MQLLTSKSEWDIYVGSVLGKIGPDEVAIDSASPTSYPCLASIAIVSAVPVVCFMYVADARALLGATQREVVHGSESLSDLVAQLARKQSSVVPAFPDVRQKIVAHDRVDFDRRVAAFIFTFLDICVPFGRSAEFERRFTANLAAVDGMHSERAEAIRKAIYGFGWLFPSEEPDASS